MPARLSILLLALLGASAASAQEPPLPPPPLVSAPQEAPASDAPLREASEDISLLGSADTGHFVPRIGLEVLGGAAGGFVGGGAGFLAGALIGLTTLGCETSACLVSAALGGILGVLAGVPAGTYLGAQLVGGRGTFSATVVGSLIGWGAMGIGYAAVAGSRAGSSDALSIALLSLPVLGSSVAYEVSHADHLPQAPRTGASPARVLPVVGFTDSGARLGLVGRF